MKSPIRSAEGLGSGAGAALPAADLRAQLARIVASPEFDATDRTRKFLAYIVEEVIAGRADRIKAYAIAIEVLGRDASFDPRSDPIVRIEAGHLRRALERYYLTAGVSDAIAISVPKGGYVPKFEALRAPSLAPPGQRPGLRWPRALPVAVASALALVALAFVGVGWMRANTLQAPALPRLLVRPFDDLTNSGNSHALSIGLTREIIGQIAKFKDIVTVEARASDAGLPALAEDSRYVLDGDVNIDDDKFRIRARVTNKLDNSVIWAKSFDGDLMSSKLMAIEAEIARQVATALAQPYGVIFRADATQQPRDAPDDWQAYSCTLAYYAYRTTLDAKTHPAVRKCLEQAVARFPNYATAWALLSQTYVDEIRFRYPVAAGSSPASIDRALSAARRAVELDPENIRALQAEMFALFFNGDVKAALKVGDLALGINPNDTELVGEFGYRLALSGNWSRGCGLIEDARTRNPGPLGYYESALALCSYFRGDYQAAATWITKTPVTANPIYHLIAAVVFAESGRTADATRERDWLEVKAPKLIGNLRDELAFRIIRPEDVDRLMASFRKAGIIPPGDGTVSLN